MTSEGSSGPSSRPAPPFVLIVSITLTGILGNLLLTPSLPDIADEFGLSGGGVGLLLSVTTAPGILLAPIIGVLADRYGRREVLFPCLLAFGLGGGLGAFAPNYGSLLALRFVQGVGSAGLINLAIVLIGDHWDGVERTKRIGRNAAALTASLCVVPPLGGALADLGGWRLTFAPYWIALLTAIGVRVVLPAGVRHDASILDQLRGTLPYLRTRVIGGAFVVGFVVFGLIFGLYLTALPVHLDDRFGVGPSMRGLIMGVPALTSVAGALSLGRVRARITVRPLLGASIGAFGVAFLLIAVSDSIFGVCVGLLVYGMGEGFCIPLLQNLVSDAAPTRTRGAVMAAFVGLGRAGQTAGPLVAGAGVASAGATATFAVGAALAGVVVVAQAGLLGEARAGSDSQALAPTLD